MCFNVFHIFYKSHLNFDGNCHYRWCNLWSTVFTSQSDDHPATRENWPIKDRIHLFYFKAFVQVIEVLFTFGKMWIVFKFLLSLQQFYESLLTSTKCSQNLEVLCMWILVAQVVIPNGLMVIFNYQTFFLVLRNQWHHLFLYSLFEQCTKRIVKDHGQHLTCHLSYGPSKLEMFNQLTDANLGRISFLCDMTMNFYSIHSRLEIFLRKFT